MQAEEIVKAMEMAGVPVPNEIILDGRIHRFPTNGKQGDRAGYYQFWDHGNGFVAGYFGDWRSGVSQKWCSKNAHELSPIQKKKVAEVQQAAETERRRLAEQARRKACKLWEKAREPSFHPYLKRKGISPLGDIKQLKSLLLIPVMDSNGGIHSLQLISPDGTKRFLAGTQVAGQFFPIGQGEPIYIAEGYATGVSIYEAIEGQGTVVVAFFAGNIKPVAKVIREANPSAKIIICADNDAWTAGNPGLTKATEAAKAIGALLAAPSFRDTSKKPTDFNDLHQLEGLQRVRDCLREAKHPELSEQEVEAELDRLAPLSPIQYDRIREEAAKRLGVRVSTLDEEVKRRRPREQGERKRGVIVEELEPWDEPVEGAELLREIKAVIQAHVVLKEEQATAISLWVALTYCYDSFRILPMLALTSPEKRCGKTTLLEVLGGLVKSPLLASNITPAALFRVIEACRPCLLIDEADTFIQGNDELRGVINSGHTRQSAFVIRVNGETLEPEKFSTWGPKVIALIGQLPDTNRDRSVEIRLQRKLPGEKVQRLLLDFAKQMEPLRRKLLRWAQDNAETLKAATPDIPEVGNDRAIDNWQPLFAIAQVAEGEWQEMARKAMLAIEATSDSATVRQELLADIREAFNGHDRMSSKGLVEALTGMDDRPWAEWRHGKPLTPNGLARLLKPFGIKSELIRKGQKVFRGYKKEMFKEAFIRYLGPDPPTQSVTTLQSHKINKLGQNQSVTKDEPVTLSDEYKYLKSLDCNSVTFAKQGAEREGIPDGQEKVTDEEQTLFEFEF